MAARTTSYVIVLSIILSAGLLAAAALAVREDQLRSGQLPPGPVIAGVDVAGMRSDEVIALLDDEVAGPLLDGNVTAGVDDVTFEMPIRDFLAIDVDGMVRDTYALTERAGLLERLGWWFCGGSVEADVPLRLDVDDAALDDWLADIAHRTDVAAVEATRAIEEDGAFLVRSAQQGRSLDRRRAATMMRLAVVDGNHDVVLPYTVLEPESADLDLGVAIHVDLSERRLHLYDGTELVKTYGVAVGTPRYPTPRGAWVVTQKRYMPSWSNPGTAWAASMPAYIPPGPSNPLGTRALNLNASGIRIHGTTSDWSIGRAASHGCMRMHRWDVEDLYERVEVGTPVFVTR